MFYKFLTDEPPHLTNRQFSAITKTSARLSPAPFWSTCSQIPRDMVSGFFDRSAENENLFRLSSGQYL